MYFTLFVVFLALAIAPVLGGGQVAGAVTSIKESVGANSMIGLLFQPNNRTSAWYNDTGPTLTAILSSEASVLAGDTRSASNGAQSTGSNNRRSVKLL